MAESGDVGLTIKEYLARIDGKVDKIDEKLDTKADIPYVLQLEGRVRQLEVTGSVHAQSALREVERVKAEHQAEIDTLWSSINWLKKKVWIAAGAAGALGAAWSLLHQPFIHIGGI